MTDKKPHRPHRWMKVALVASLALNLAVVGVVAGALISGKKPDGDRSVRVSPALSQYVRSLPADMRQNLGQKLRQNRGDRAKLAELRASFDDVIAIIEAETFDLSALNAALDAQSQIFRNAGNIRLQAGRAAFVDTIAQMDAETRRAYATELRARLERRKGKSRP